MTDEKGSFLVIVVTFYESDAYTPSDYDNCTLFQLHKDSFTQFKRDYDNDVQNIMEASKLKTNEFFEKRYKVIKITEFNKKYGKMNLELHKLNHNVFYLMNFI